MEGDLPPGSSIPDSAVPAEVVSQNEPAVTHGNQGRQVGAGEEEAKDDEADSEPVGTLTAKERRVLCDFRAAEAAKERAEAACEDTGAGGDSRDLWGSIFEDRSETQMEGLHAAV